MLTEFFPLLILGVGALFAGFIDSVVGGGGLIQIPVLFTTLSSEVPATLFGTNKIASIFGTGNAAFRYMQRVRIPWRTLVPATLAAFVFAFLGAMSVAWLPRELLRPLILVLLIVSAAYTFWRKDFGHVEARALVPADRWRAALLGLVIGFYDGFFGPGTGSFLIFGFVRLFGMDFIRASASAKVINAATNVSAIAFFASHGPILWLVALVMAVCNLAGAQVGTALALRRGAGFVRQAFLLVVTVLIGKLAWDMLGG